jgi:hypothetical protein
MKTSTCLILAVVLILAGVGVVSADFSGPFYDTYVTLGSAGANNPTAISMFVQDSTGVCTDTQIAYIQFSAGTIGTVTSASLVLTEGATAIGLDGATAPMLTLYGVADFDQASLSSTNAPKTTDSGVVVIQSQSMPSSAVARGTKLTWGGSDPGLMNYIQSQINGDKVVTLAMSFSANCNSVNSQMNFFTQDYNTDLTFRPVLNIAATPSAVTMSTFQAANPAANWPLITGLGALVALAAGGVLFYRKRATTH